MSQCAGSRHASGVLWRVYLHRAEGPQGQLVSLLGESLPLLHVKGFVSDRGPSSRACIAGKPPIEGAHLVRPEEVSNGEVEGLLLRDRELPLLDPGVHMVLQSHRVIWQQSWSVLAWRQHAFNRARAPRLGCIKACELVIQTAVAVLAAVR